MNNHGKVFTISDASQIESRSLIPKRANVLNKKDIARTKASINSGTDLLFLANDVEQSISKNKYELMLHGITPCGSKTTIIIKGILPYIDIRVNDIANAEQEKNAIQSKLDSFDIEFVRVEIVDGQDFMNFCHEEKKYLRVYFETLKNRLSCINMCAEDNIKTFSNDKSTYYRVVARKYEINLSGWNLIKGYKEIFGSKYKSRFVLSIDIKDIKAYSDEEHSTDMISLQDFKYEKMILASFDIEMIPHNLNHFPDADKCLKDSIFMICVTFHFAKKTESILSVCLTLKENDPLEDVVTIVCESEAVLLLAFSKLFEMMQPEFITEFNGGGFDWRNIITKSLSFGIIGQFLQNMSLTQLEFWEIKPNMISRYFSEKNIKVGGSSGYSLCKSLKLPGYINFDTLVVFKQLEPTADSHKLNECLKRCNLGSKDDMDIQEMFRIYREGTTSEMKMVAHYCFIDTFKLQSLILKKNVIQDRREVSVLSYTSIFDSFYYANGGKVRNLLMNGGEKRNYMFDTLYKPTVEDPEAKFPGAFVVPPIKGIVKPRMRFDEFLSYRSIPFDQDIIDDGYKFVEEHYEAIDNNTLDLNMKMLNPVHEYMCYMMDNENQYPVSGLDYSSLYPSIIMTYNISPETLVTDEKYAKYLISIGINMFYVTFKFLGRDFHAWFKQHNNDTNEYGLCPAILIDLFAKRARMKKIMKPYADKKLDMELEMKQYKDDPDAYPRLEEYNEVVFDFNYYNAKQNALKVFMNTFYGEMGNFVSFICAVETAASVTTMGQFNLKLAKAYVEDKLRMKIYYGDSVVGETPIMIKRNNCNELLPIEELDTDYELYRDGKECIDYSNKNVYVMTEDGYSKILKVIRHRTNKKLFRITTHIGSVIVTEDHSLLDLNKNKIKPQDCAIGTSLLHWIPELTPVLDNLSIDNNIYEQGRICGTKRNEKVPQEILDGDSATKFAFVQGYYAANYTMSNTTQIGAQGLYLLLSDLGYNVSVQVDGQNYSLLFTQECTDITAIKSIEELGSCDDYVYDLETESHHFAAGVGRMVVHNTDSLYIACNKSHFTEIDREYFIGKINKLDYGTQLVEKTFELIEIAKNEVNEHLFKNNGSKFLKMAYEEVLYPAIFLSKKKYMGIPHEEKINFYPKKPFLRGLEVVKRGTSDVLKDICMKIIMEILDIKCVFTMLELVAIAIKRFFNTEWDVKQFVKTAVYKLDKQNAAVRNLIGRYERDQYKIIPEPNVRFKYIVCKRYPWVYNDQGNQTELSIGDKMELLERVLEENIPIDLEYYFNNEITGQMARLIAYEDQFDTIDRDAISLDFTEKERYKKIEESLFKNAKKHIAELAKAYSNPYTNKGKLHKKTYKAVSAVIRAKNQRTRKVTSIHPSNVRRVVDILNGCDSDNSIIYLKKKLQSYIKRHYGVEVVINVDDITQLHEYIIQNKLNKYLTDCTEEWISNIVQYIRTEYDYDTICEMSLDIDDIDDILTTEELKEITKKEELYVGLTIEQANDIINMISSIVAIYV